MSEKNGQKDIFESLVLARDEYLSSQEEVKAIYEKMNKELIEAERKIRLSYQEKISLSKKNCSTLRKDLENYKELLETYSTFDAKMIGNII